MKSRIRGAQPPKKRSLLLPPPRTRDPRSFLSVLFSFAVVAFLSACAENGNLPLADQAPDSVEMEVLDASPSASSGGRTVRRIDGNGQRGEAGRTLRKPLVAQVVNSSGRPIPGFAINWKVNTGNGEVSREWVRTDKQGMARVEFTLGTDVTKHRAVARIAGARVTFVALSSGGEGGGGGSPGSVVLTPREMELRVGDSESFRATVYGENGKVDSQAPVRWRSSNGSVATVNSSGTVTARSVGSTRITARSTNGRARAELSVVDGSTGGVSIARVSGNSQTGPVEQPLEEPLRVRVRRESGGPAPGKAVEWEVTRGSGSVSDRSTRSDETGHTEVVFTLGEEAAAQNVRASVEGKRVTFTAMGESSSGNGELALQGNGGNNQTGAPNETLANPIRVRVVNGSGDVVPGVTVNWSIVDGGGSVSASSTTTDNRGRSEVEFTLGGGEGRHQARATIEGGANFTFSATAQGGGGDPPTVETVRVEPGSFTLGSIGANRTLVAVGLDAQGNEVPGTSFNWSSNNNGVATVNSGGRVTAAGVGTTEIVATADCCGSPTATSTVRVEDSGPPPPTPGGFAHLPSSWRVVNDNPWNLVPNWSPSCPAQSGGIDGFDAANGWGKIISSGPGGCPEGDGAVVQLGDAPDGDPNVFRMTWNPGHPAGQDGYGVAYSLPGGGSRDVYFGIWFRFGEAGDPGSFKRHGNGLKMFAFDGHGSFRRANMGWSDGDFGGGPCPDAFAMDAPDGQFGDSDHWTSAFPGYAGVWRRASCMAGQEHHQRGFYAHPDQGHHPSVRMTVGEWHLLEIRWDANPARIRWWWDGILAADFTGGQIPGAVRDIYMDGTWGGGPSSIPAPQHWYIARTVVAVP